MSLISNNIKYSPHYTYQEYEILKQNNFRYYQIQNHLVPSVTSILRLSRWNQRDAKSYRQEQSFEIGNLMHEYLFHYATGHVHPRVETKNQIIAKKLSDSIINNFFPNVSCILAAEAIVHDNFSYAGTFDLLAQVNNELTIVDYKSAFRKKGNYLIDEYFQQIAAYAEAHDKMHGTNINQFMIVMVYKDNFDCEILIANNSESIKYRKMWQDKLNYYKEVSVE